MAANDTGERSTTERFGLAGLGAMLLAHLLWDPAVTLVGVAQFGLEREGNRLVRDLIRLHPAAWLAAKVLVLVPVAGAMYGLGVHRDAETAWLPWAIALLGAVAPLGWLELLV